ncbi:MAG: hypothetical protein U1F68_13160 [Gammaproteobacteria bacterium]
MYVDKRLDGVQAVQTLSRLNRMIPGKDAPFVLDFVNEADDIVRAFKPYYDKTELAEASDPIQLESLKHELDQAQVYHWSEVEAFAQIFYQPPERQSPADHAHLQRHLQPAVDRFKALDDEMRQAFRDKLSGYIKVYAFLSQIIPYADPDLEMLYSYGRFLLPHLPVGRDVTVVSWAPTWNCTTTGWSAYPPVPWTSATASRSTSKVRPRWAPAEPRKKRRRCLRSSKYSTSASAPNSAKSDRLFFQQIKEKACKSERVIQKLRLPTRSGQIRTGHPQN